MVFAFILSFHCNSKQSLDPPSQSEAIYLNPAYSVEERVTDCLARMTLDEKIGQMTQIDRGFLKQDSDITLYRLGSILSGGGSSPGINNVTAWADMYDGFQLAALQTPVKIPLIYGIDAVHGHNNVFGAVIFPHNIGLGCTRNPDLVEEAARITALEVAATGIDWTFGPCIAVPQDERWGRTYEGFGETADLTIDMARASVSGFQGTALNNTGSILACTKHFLGDGGTLDGRDQGDVQLSESELRQIHLPGYISAIEAGVGSIMASYNSWNGQKIHGSEYLLTDVLKGELGFDGFIVSDWAAINQLPGDYASDIEQAINAGIDMVMVPDIYEEFITTLMTLVNDERIPLSRIDDAVSRILRIKFKLGLFENPLTDRSLMNDFGSQSHREVARECVRQSLVLLKNDNSLLPLSKSLNRIHVSGKNANDLGAQCGGWTISWQGSRGLITLGTTVLQAIKNTVSSSTSVTFNIDGKQSEGADVGVVVIGESPYAEGVGDRWDLNLSQADTDVIQSMKDAGLPLVVILISGRPMIVDSILDHCDAFIAAWLPGTEGQGAADVLFGDYAPTGILSHSWPRNMAQIPINVGDVIYNPLFDYGFGLTY